MIGDSEEDYVFESGRIPLGLGRLDGADEMIASGGGE
jgi:hypothetical protein